MLIGTVYKGRAIELIMKWLASTWELLQVRGWWFAAGIILCAAGMILLQKESKKLFWPLVLGVLLPVCNFAAVPLAGALWYAGTPIGVIFAFLSAATLLNPSGILLAFAYMGTELAAAWILGAVAVSLAAGIAGTYLLHPAESSKTEQRMTALARDFFVSIPKLAFWLVLGILAQAFLQMLMPEKLWNQILLDAEGTSFLKIFTAGLFRHVCIPDDVPLAASLVATGLRPGYAVLFLLAGVCTNLPELFVLYGVAGKQTTAVYLCITAAAGAAAAFLTQMLIGADFTPLFNLANAETYTRIANALSIRTWMPARMPCAIGLVLIAGWGMWKQRKS